MVEMLIGMPTLEGLLFTILERLTQGNIDDAIAAFAEEFSFKDHGIGLEFTDKERLAEFFQRARDLLPRLYAAD